LGRGKVGKPSRIEAWKQRAKRLQEEVYALYFAGRHPEVPWYAKLLAAAVVAYAFSPIDLIPDFIPVIGYLDDLLLVPLGIYLVVRMIPKPVMEECRQRARDSLNREGPRNWKAAAVIIAIWLAVMGLAVVIGIRVLG
jgi:uncharacterized membrane protein YkvA (DUF1232 family)